jgi:GT2 family glycosyltransferase
LKEAGGRAALVAEARIYHKVGATLQRAGTSSYYWYRSRLLFARKHCASTYRAVVAATLVDALREAARQARRGRYTAALLLLHSHWWAFVDHFRSRYGRRFGAPRTVHGRP